jgi:hypothetical protein
MILLFKFIVDALRIVLALGVVTLLFKTAIEDFISTIEDLMGPKAA